MIYCQEIKKGKIINFTKDEEIAISLGWLNKVDEQELETAYDGQIYLKGYAPQKPEPTKEEQREKRARAYQQEVDPIMAEYTRKKTFNLFEEGEEEKLLADIEAKVEDIKARYPYPVEPIEKIEELPVVEEAVVSNSNSEEVI